MTAFDCRISMPSPPGPAPPWRRVMNWSCPPTAARPSRDSGPIDSRQARRNVALISSRAVSPFPSKSSHSDRRNDRSSAAGSASPRRRSTRAIVASTAIT
jgi:hypothetical protein